MNATFVRSLFVAASLMPSLPMCAAEAFYVIDAGFVTSLDTSTGAVLSSWMATPLAGGLAFSNHDTLYVLTDRLTGEKAYRYGPGAMPHSWELRGDVSQNGGIRAGRGLALRHNGTVFAIGQNSHDLWILQQMSTFNPLLGHVRLYDPQRFPTHIAANPFSDLYATWFYNGTLQVTKDTVNLFTTPGFAGVEGLCFDYTGYPWTDPVTQATSTHGLLYISNGNGNTIRRYDAETMQPWGKPASRTDPVLVNGSASGMTGVDRMAVDAETGTLYVMGRHQNYKDAFNYADIVIAGFSTVDGTPRGLGGSTTDPVVYHRPWGNAIKGFAIRPAVQTQTYAGGTHPLNSMTFADPGKTLALISTAASTVAIQPGASLPSLSFSSIISDGMRAISSIGSVMTILSAAMNKGGSLMIPATSTVNITTGATATGGGTIEVAQGGTLNCPAADVTIGVNSRFRAGGLIAAKTLLAESGAVIAPGASPGMMTLDGNLQLKAGSTLEIEIGGTQAGITHDAVIVQNAAVAELNGRLVPQLTDGFTPQPAHAFTVLTSNVALTGTLQNLSSGRVSTATGRGSFALTFINGGTGIQLSDYQAVPPEQAWRNTYFSAAQQADPLISGDDADPDIDGLKNILEFALNSDPLSGAASANLPSASASPAPAFTFIRYSGGTVSSANYDFAGVRHVIQGSTALAGWAPLAPGDPAVTSWTITPNADGITETVRMTLASTLRQVRMMVTRQ